MLSESGCRLLINGGGVGVGVGGVEYEQVVKDPSVRSIMDLQNNNHIGVMMATTTTTDSISRNDDGTPSSPSSVHNGDQQGFQQQAPTISVILTIRLLMQGKEVGSIIGKRGDHIKIIRDESNAKINISDGSCPERIVTITGNVENIHKAFTMICRKFEDDMQQLPNSVPKPPITFRLIVPATQCGSLIGKGGSKIKEIREATGASIQVASEMLPNSTERAVTISGTADAIILCMHQICHILLESPPKGATIPYRPKPTINPLLLATSAAAAAAAQQPCSTAVLQPNAFCQFSPELTKIHPLNQLLPGFNPTVLGNGFPTASGVLSLPSAAATAAANHQAALFGNELALAANAFANGQASASAKTGESYTSYAANAMNRQQADLEKSQNEALSQYVLNSSPTRASAANTALDVSSIASSTSASTTSTYSASQQQQQQRKSLAGVATVSSASALASAATMASIAAGHPLHKGMASTNDAAARQQHQHLNALAAAALAGGNAIRSGPIHPHQHQYQQQQQQQQRKAQAGFQLPFLQYSPNGTNADMSSNNADARSSNSAAAAAALNAAHHQQQQQAWLNMIHAAAAAAGSSSIGSNFAFNTQFGSTFLPLTGGGGANGALMFAGGAPPPPPQPSHGHQMLYQMGQQQQSQLLALQQAAAAAAAASSLPGGGGGGPIVGCLGEKLAKRFTPY